MNITLETIKEGASEVSTKYGWIAVITNLLLGILFVILVLKKATKA